MNTKALGVAPLVLTLTLALAAACAPQQREMSSAELAAMGKESHAHMGHVAKSWTDTPEQMALLATAEAEAEVALQHAGFAAQKPGDLGWMQLHAGHVLNALDPAAEAKGPGLGYGVIRAAEGVAKHIGFAAAAGDASDTVKLHATHVATSAANVAAWGREAAALAAQVKAAGSAATAAPLTARLEAACRRIVQGADANGDGKVTWAEGEGGLAQARQHMQFMIDGESKA